MNRIAGILHFDHRPVDPREINRMNNVLKLLNHDEHSVLINGEIGLGCTYIGEIQSEHSNHLLFHLSDEQYALAFDGRIDNRRELMATLRREWLADRAQVSDEEIVLAAYDKWGLECPKHLLGDFAFAIWDKEKHRLICVRDHFGVKPLYYYFSSEAFVFASNPHALLASGDVPAVIHEERIADFLVDPLEGIDKTSSFYKDVFRLPPAHILIVQAGEMKMERYWELCPMLQPELKSDEEYVEAFQGLFTESVRCRLFDVPASASMLSGGMDSSAIVGIGRKILAEEGRDPIRALAVISNSPATNRETSYISLVLNQGNLQSHLISETELSQGMDKLVNGIEAEAEPFDCLMNLNRVVYLRAQEQGISALLDGIDGDVLLSGSGQLMQLWREGAYRTILEETLKADGLIAEYKMGRKLFMNSLLSVIIPFAPDWFRRLRRPFRSKKALRSAVQDAIIDPDFAVQSHLGDRFAMLDSHSPRLRSSSQIDAHKIALDHPFLTVGLERYERVASAFGIEARHPFTDVRLAEFCLGLPWQLKTRHGWTKMILRRALEPYLPPEVIWRKDKDSLMWEVNRLILKARAEYFYQITADEGMNLKPYIDLRKLMNFWHEYLTQGEEKHAELIWSGVALAMWLRRQRDMQVSLR